MAPVVSHVQGSGFGFWHNCHACVTLFFLPHHYPVLGRNCLQSHHILYWCCNNWNFYSMSSQSQCDPIQWSSFPLSSFSLCCHLFCSIAHKLTPFCCWETDSFLQSTARWCYASYDFGNTKDTKEWKPSCELNRMINLLKHLFLS